MSFSSGAAAAMATTTGEYKANDKCRKFIIIFNLCGRLGKGLYESIREEKSLQTSQMEDPFKWRTNAMICGVTLVHSMSLTLIEMYFIVGIYILSITKKVKSNI